MTDLGLASHTLANSTRRVPFSVSIARNLSSCVFVVWQQYGDYQHKERKGDHGQEEKGQSPRSRSPISSVYSSISSVRSFLAELFGCSLCRPNGSIAGVRCVHHATLAFLRFLFASATMDG